MPFQVISSLAQRPGKGPTSASEMEASAVSIHGAESHFFALLLPVAGPYRYRGTMACNSTLDGAIGRLFCVLYGQPGSLSDYSAQRWE